MAEPRPTSPLTAILQESTNLISTALEQVEWAESEIDAAIARYPAQRDLLYHGFSLLVPTHQLMATEFVSRSHYRELLNRLATGKDTRPGTAAEVCCACADASLVAPLTSTAAGLYFRMWESAFPDKPPITDRTRHHEALNGSSIDALEATSRRTLARQDRVIGDISCSGMHDGETVRCAYVTTTANGTDQAASARNLPPRASREQAASSLTPDGAQAPASRQTDAPSTQSPSL